MSTVASLAAALLAAPRPVLMVDTCVLLDILRAPHRGWANHLAAVSRVFQAVTSTPPTCALVGASITTREFADHLQEERTRLEGFLGELQDRAMAHHIACLEVGIGSTAPAFHGSGLPDALARMAQSLLATATFLDADLPAQGRAVQRALDGRRPAKRGAVKDAIMIEEYLALARELRAGQYTPTLVFLSSNPNDFCVGTGRHLHPDLAGDFQATNLGFGMTWPAAVGLLGL